MKRISIFTTSLVLALNSIFAQTVGNPHTGKITICNEPHNLPTQIIDTPEELFSATIGKDEELIAFKNIEPKTKDLIYKKVEYTVYRLQDMQKLFYKKYNPDNNYYSLTDSFPYIIRFDVNKASVLDMTTGKKVWSKTGRFVRLLNGNVIMHFQGLGNFDSYINALSIKTGEKVWSSKLNLRQGISYNYTIDENCDYLVGNDLCRINWETGEVKQLESKTSITDKAELFADMLSGIYYGPTGATMGTMVGSRNYYQPVEYAKLEEESERPFNRSLFMYPEHTKISGLTSGIVRNNGRNYYADRNSIRCFDDDMNEIWNTPLQVKATRSDIFLRNDTIYMINLAMGMYGSRGMSPREYPYVAAFSAKDGHQLFHKEWDKKKKNPITASTIINNKLHMISSKREVIFDLATQQVDVAEIDTTAGGPYIKYALTDYIFKRNESEGSFTAINVSSDFRPVLTSNGVIVDIYPQKPELISGKHNTFYCIGHTKDYALLRGGNDLEELWLIRDGKATQLSNSVTMVTRRKNKLFMFTEDDKLNIITLEP